MTIRWKQIRNISLIAAGLGLALPVAAFAWRITDPRPEPTRSPDRDGPMFVGRMVVQAPGYDTPATVSADEATIEPNEKVIGVLGGEGIVRAYRIKAFGALNNHVVNDILGGVPVTVTHCNLTGCTRVFTGNGKDPLPIGTGGFDGGLMLLTGNRLYDQKTGVPDVGGPGQFPFQAITFEEMTWESWRAAHPGTDIYVDSPNHTVAAESAR